MGPSWAPESSTFLNIYLYAPYYCLHEAFSAYCQNIVNPWILPLFGAVLYGKGDYDVQMSQSFFVLCAYLFHVS